jgi:hypothetical protein
MVFLKASLMMTPWGRSMKLHECFIKTVFIKHCNFRHLIITNDYSNRAQEDEVVAKLDQRMSTD